MNLKIAMIYKFVYKNDTIITKQKQTTFSRKMMRTAFFADVICFYKLFTLALI